MKHTLKTLGFFILAAGVVALCGCRQKAAEEPAASEQANAACAAECTKPCCAAKTDGDDKACIETCCAKDAAAADAAPAASSAVEQTLCPVMKSPINKELFIEYQGKKVYFCCPGCEDEFKKNSEKYLPELPQFKK